MNDAAAEYDFVLVRKPFAPREWFTCAICNGLQEFGWRETRLTRASRMVCNHCEQHWGRHLGQTYRATRGDRHQFQRLSAVTNALDWEIKNGKNRRRFTAF